MNVYSSFNEMDGTNGNNDVSWNFIGVGIDRHAIQLEIIGSIDPGTYQYVVSGAGGNFKNAEGEGWQCWVHANGIEKDYRSGTSMDTALFTFNYEQ